MTAPARPPSPPVTGPSDRNAWDVVMWLAAAGVVVTAWWTSAGDPFPFEPWALLVIQLGAQVASSRERRRRRAARAAALAEFMATTPPSGMGMAGARGMPPLWLCLLCGATGCCASRDVELMDALADHRAHGQCAGGPPRVALLRSTEQPHSGPPTAEGGAPTAH